MNNPIKWSNDNYEIRTRISANEPTSKVYKIEKEYCSKKLIPRYSKSFENLPKYIKAQIESMEKEIANL